MTEAVVAGMVNDIPKPVTTRGASSTPRLSRARRAPVSRAAASSSDTIPPTVQVGEGGDCDLGVGGALLSEVLCEAGDEGDDVLGGAHEVADGGVDEEEVGEVTERVEGAQLFGVARNSVLRVDGRQRGDGVRGGRADEMQVEVRLHKADELVCLVGAG